MKNKESQINFNTYTKFSLITAGIILVFLSGYLAGEGLQINDNNVENNLSENKSDIPACFPKDNVTSLDKENVTTGKNSSDQQQVTKSSKNITEENLTESGNQSLNVSNSSLNMSNKK